MEKHLCMHLNSGELFLEKLKFYHTIEILVNRC